MLADSPAFSGFSVDDLDAARRSTRRRSASASSEVPGGRELLRLHLGCGTRRVVYAKPDHVPATFTVLNFPVPDIEAAVDALTARGVQFQHYEHPPTDERGIMRAGGPLIAWFTDPAGNVFSVCRTAEHPSKGAALSALSANLSLRSVTTATAARRRSSCLRSPPEESSLSHVQVVAAAAGSGHLSWLEAAVVGAAAGRHRAVPGLAASGTRCCCPALIGGQLGAGT